YSCLRCSRAPVELLANCVRRSVPESRERESTLARLRPSARSHSPHARPFACLPPCDAPQLKPLRTGAVSNPPSSRQNRSTDLSTQLKLSPLLWFLSMYDLRRLRAFHAVANCGSSQQRHASSATRNQSSPTTSRPSRANWG